jgi:hypothetical protein
MKLGKLQKVLAAFLTLWACVYSVLLCSSFGMFVQWLNKITISLGICLSAYCTPNPSASVSAPVLEGTAGFVYNPLVILLNFWIYFALIRFYSRLWQTRQGRRAESKRSDAQFDKGGTEKEGASAEE